MKPTFPRMAFALALMWLATPDVSAACERCFGAAVDSPVITAISASMFVLLVLFTGVFGSIVQFFRNAAERGQNLTEDDFPHHTD